MVSRHSFTHADRGGDRDSDVISTSASDDLTAIDVDVDTLQACSTRYNTFLPQLKRKYGEYVVAFFTSSI